jgi:Cysteine rich repeat
MMKTVMTAGLLLTLSGSYASALDIHLCKADVARICQGVEPGQGRIVKCLKAHEDEISIGCAKELKKMKG